MRVLVTGGAGFIGSNFVRMAIDGKLPGLEDAQLTVLDALTYSGTLANLKSVENSPRFSFIHGDIRDPAIVKKAMEGHNAVVHFAAESHVDRSVNTSRIFVETNVLGTQTLLDQALAQELDKFVHVSTDEVYGSI